MSVNIKFLRISNVSNGTDNLSVNLTEGKNFQQLSKELPIQSKLTNIYGVEWEGTESTKLTRTDAAALFKDPSPAVNGGTGSSPFDNIMPWKDIKRVTIDGNELVAIPKFWYKWTKESPKMKLQIADGPEEGFSLSPAHAGYGDGRGERDIVYIARYHCAEDDYKSKTGCLPKTNIKSEEADTGCLRVGTGYRLIDYSLLWTVRMLYLVEYADWNSQKVIGYGCGNGKKVETGKSDTMRYHTGTMQSDRDTPGAGVQYRYIEDLWGNVENWCNGVYGYHAKISITNQISGYKEIVHMSNYQVQQCINSWTVPTDEGYEWALFPNDASVSNYDTYCADQCSASTVYGSYSNSYDLVIGYYYGSSQWAGIFCMSMVYPTSTYDYLGARLQYLPY